MNKTITVSEITKLAKEKAYTVADELLDVWHDEDEEALMCSAQRVIEFNNGLIITIIENETILKFEYHPDQIFQFNELHLRCSYDFDISGNFTLLDDETNQRIYVSDLYDADGFEDLMDINYRGLDYDDFI